MDINILGIGLNDALCPNSYELGLEEFENFLYAAVEPAIAGNLVEPLSVNSEPVLDLSTDESSPLTLDEFDDTGNLTEIESEIDDLQSLIDSKLEVNQSSLDVNLAIDSYFTEITKLLEQQNDQAKLAVLYKASEMDLDSKAKADLANYLLDSAVSATLADVFLTAVINGMDEEKLEFIENNKYLVLAENNSDQQMILESLLDFDNLTENDTVFAKALIDLIKEEKRDKVDVLLNTRELNLTEDDQAKFLELLLNQLVSVTVAESFIDIVSSTGDMEKLNYLENNKYEISCMQETDQKKLLTCLLDSANSSENDLLKVSTMQHFIEAGDRDRLTILDKIKNLSLNPDQEKQFISYLWIDSDLAEAYLGILGSGADQEKLDFLDQNKDLIGACNDEVTQNKILDFLQDDMNLTNSDTAFTERLVHLLELGDNRGIELLYKARDIELNSAQEDKFLDYINDKAVSNTVSDAYLDLVMCEANEDKINFLELNKYIISSLDEAKQKKIVEYLMDSDCLTKNDIAFTSKLITCIKSGDEKAVNALDTARQYLLGDAKEDLFLKYFSMTNTADQIQINRLLESLSINRSGVNLSFESVFNALVKQGDKVKLDLLVQGNLVEMDLETRNEWRAALIEKNVSVDFVKTYLGLVKSNADPSKLSFLAENKFKISDLSKDLQKKILDSVTDSVSFTDKDVSFTETYLRLARRGDLTKLNVLEQNRETQFSSEQKERFLDYLSDANISVNLIDAFLDVINSGADDEKIKYLSENKYLISSLDSATQDQVLDCLVDLDNLTKDDTAFVSTLITLLRNQDNDRLAVLLRTRDLDLSLEQEERFSNYFLDDNVSLGLIETYSKLLNSKANTEKLDFIDDNKYAISSLSNISQTKVLNYLADENALINQKQPERFSLLSKLNILEEPSVLSLNEIQEKQLLNYIMDNKVSANLTSRYLDLVNLGSESEKLIFLENNKYLVAGLSKTNQDRFFKYLVDSDDKLHEDLLFTKILIHFAQQGAVSKVNALDSGFELDLSSEQEKQFLRYLLDSKLSSRIAVGYAELASANIATKVLDLLKNNQSSISLLNRGLQEKLADQMKAAANYSEESLSILGLSFSLIQDYKIDKNAAVQFSKILESERALEDLQDFKQHNNLQKVLVDPHNILNDHQLKSSAQKISKIGKFLGVNIETSQSNNVTAVNKMIEVLSNEPLKQFETKQDHEQKLLADYQSRLDSYTVLIMDELSKGDKLDPKKLELLQAKRNNLENSIQAIENSRNSTSASNQRDPYLQRQIDEILSNGVVLNVL
ncbi:MAG: hypothetical protein ACKO3R_06005 [bacterium]